MAAIQCIWMEAMMVTNISVVLLMPGKPQFFYFFYYIMFGSSNIFLDRLEDAERTSIASSNLCGRACENVIG